MSSVFITGYLTLVDLTSERKQACQRTLAAVTSAGRLNSWIFGTSGGRQIYDDYNPATELHICHWIGGYKLPKAHQASNWGRKYGYHFNRARQ